MLHARNGFKQVLDRNIGNNEHILLYGRHAIRGFGTHDNPCNGLRTPLDLDAPEEMGRKKERKARKKTYISTAHFMGETRKADIAETPM